MGHIVYLSVFVLRLRIKWFAHGHYLPHPLSQRQFYVQSGNLSPLWVQILQAQNHCGSHQLVNMQLFLYDAPNARECNNCDWGKWIPILGSPRTCCCRKHKGFLEHLFVFVRNLVFHFGQFARDSTVWNYHVAGSCPFHEISKSDVMYKVKWQLVQCHPFSTLAIKCFWSAELMASLRRWLDDFMLLKTCCCSKVRSIFNVWCFIWRWLLMLDSPFAKTSGVLQHPYTLNLNSYVYKTSAESLSYDMNFTCDSDTLDVDLLAWVSIADFWFTFTRYGCRTS